MRSLMTLFAAMTIFFSLPSPSSAAPVRGVYLETRTCQVYTGPCFAQCRSGHRGARRNNGLED